MTMNIEKVTAYKVDNLVFHNLKEAEKFVARKKLINHINKIWYRNMIESDSDLLDFIENSKKEILEYLDKI